MFGRKLKLSLCYSFRSLKNLQFFQSYFVHKTNLTMLFISVKKINLQCFNLAKSANDWAWGKTLTKVRMKTKTKIFFFFIFCSFSMNGCRWTVTFVSGTFYLKASARTRRIKCHNGFKLDGQKGVNLKELIFTTILGKSLHSTVK